MILPTPTTIASFFRLDIKDARKVRKALENREEVSIPRGGWITKPWDLALHYATLALNEIEGGKSYFDVEAINGEWSNGYWCDVRAIYINSGDTYNATLLYDRETNRIYCTTMGDFVEHLERKGELVQ